MRAKLHFISICVIVEVWKQEKAHVGSEQKKVNKLHTFQSNSREY